MTMPDHQELPPLPEPFNIIHGVHYFNAPKMYEYALQAFEAGKRSSPAVSGEAELRSALNAMLTYFGMDEDEWSKPTFDKARAALARPTVDAKDAARLDWLLHHLSGKEMRRIGIETTSGGPLWGRVAIDAAMNTEAKNG